MKQHSMYFRSTDFFFGKTSENITDTWGETDWIVKWFVLSVKCKTITKSKWKQRLCKGTLIDWNDGRESSDQWLSSNSDMGSSGDYVYEKHVT